MRDKAPADFDIEKFFKGIYIFQEWELFPGFSTRGQSELDPIGWTTGR